MASFLSDSILDNGLSHLTNNGDAIYITSALSTTYTAATSTNALGYKTSISIGSPADRTDTGNGRKVTVPSISGGTVSATGTASHYAIVDTANSAVLAAGTLTSSQSVTSGNTFSIPTSFDIGIPDAT